MEDSPIDCFSEILREINSDDPGPFYGTIVDEPVPLADSLADGLIPLSDIAAEDPAPIFDNTAERHADLTGNPDENHQEDFTISLSDISDCDSDPPLDTLAGDPDLPPTWAEGTTAGRHYLRLVLVHLCLGLLGGFIAVAVLFFFQQATKPLQNKCDDLQKYNSQIKEEIIVTEKNSTSLQSKYSDLQNNSTVLEGIVAYYKKYVKELHFCRSNLSVVAAAVEDFRVNGSCEVCANGWEYFLAKCYFFPNDLKSWPESRDDCTSRGASLVRVETAAEQDFLTDQIEQKMATAEDKFWIGLTDAKTEGRWVWVNNAILDEHNSFWNGTEPDDRKGVRGERVEGEDCASTGGSQCRTACWSDSVCKKSLRRICETLSV